MHCSLRLHFAVEARLLCQPTQWNKFQAALFLHDTSDLTEFRYHACISVAQECFLFEFDKAWKNKVGKIQMSPTIGLKRSYRKLMEPENRMLTSVAVVLEFNLQLM